MRPSTPSTEIAQYYFYTNDHNCIEYTRRETKKPRLIEAEVIRNQEECDLNHEGQKKKIEVAGGGQGERPRL